MEINQIREIFHTLFNKINNIFTAVGANKMILEEDISKLSAEELRLRLIDLIDAMKMIDRNILVLNDRLREVYDDIKKEKDISTNSSGGGQ